MEEGQIIAGESTQTCRSCKTVTYKGYYFCPMCGKKLREKPLSLSVGQQLKAYLLSFFFLPSGLSYAIRYLKQEGRSSKIAGVVCLTIIAASIVIAVYEYVELIGYMNTVLVDGQLNTSALLNYPGMPSL